MAENTSDIFLNLINVLQQDYRGVNIAVYALATAGLAVSIHKIRPVSKFSKARKIPEHFIRNHEPLKGVCVGVQNSPVRVLVDHKAPIYLPLWHSSKPPLPVKIWGVEVISGNAVNWLDCVTKGQHVTLKPITKENDDLASVIMLHSNRGKAVETLDVGKKLVELGFARASIPKEIKKDTVEYKLAPILQSAEMKARSFRNGIWSDILPPVPFYVIYWRKATKFALELLVLTCKKLFILLFVTFKGALTGIKSLAQKAIRSSSKQVQTS